MSKKSRAKLRRLGSIFVTRQSAQSEELNVLPDTSDAKENQSVRDLEPLISSPLPRRSIDYTKALIKNGFCVPQGVSEIRSAEAPRGNRHLLLTESQQWLLDNPSRLDRHAASSRKTGSSKFAIHQDKTALDLTLGITPTASIFSKEPFDEDYGKVIIETARILRPEQALLYVRVDGNKLVFRRVARVLVIE